ncbi:MAG: phage tail protein, partial [Hydrogenoanaerobacterium sp.]
QIIAALVGGLGQAVGAVFDIGKNIVEGLWEGIQSLGGWIADKVSSFFGSIVDGAKDLLGIHSPSTVFAGIGKNMGAGIGVGFEAAMSGVEKDMMNAIPTDFDLSANVNGAVSQTAPNGKMSLGGAINLTIQNFYNNRAQDIEQLAYELEFYRQRVAFAKGGA